MTWNICSHWLVSCLQTSHFCQMEIYTRTKSWKPLDNSTEVTLHANQCVSSSQSNSQPAQLPRVTGCKSSCIPSSMEGTGLIHPKFWDIPVMVSWIYLRRFTWKKHPFGRGRWPWQQSCSTCTLGNLRCMYVWIDGWTDGWMDVTAWYGMVRYGTEWYGMECNIMYVLASFHVSMYLCMRIRKYVM